MSKQEEYKVGSFEREVDKKSIEYALLNGISGLRLAGYSKDAVIELVERMFDNPYEERRRIMLWKC